MLSRFTKRYVEKTISEAKSKGIPVYDDYMEMFQSYETLVKSFNNKYKLKFADTGDVDKYSLNGYAGYKESTPIIMTPEWAAQLVIRDEKEYRRHNAFKLSLGHELGHKISKDIPTFKSSLKYGFKNCYKHFTLLAHSNEVHHDFYGAYKMADGSRKALIDAIKFKKDFKVNVCRQNDTSNDPRHPSWSRREYYATNFNYNKKLINEIASNIGLDPENKKTKALIKEIHSFYDEIILKDDNV